MEINEKDDINIVNMSSNIRANKRVIIGRFDARNLFFISISLIVCLILSTIFFLFFDIKYVSIYVVFSSLIIFPIMSLGFREKHGILYLDYIKLKLKCKNSKIRSLIKSHILDKKLDKYIICFSLEKDNNENIDFDFINKTIKELNKLFEIYQCQVRIEDKIYISINVDIYAETKYDEIFKYFHKNGYVRPLSINEINNKNNEILEDKDFTIYKVHLIYKNLNLEFIKEVSSFAKVVRYIKNDINDTPLDTFIIVRNNDIEKINQNLNELCDIYDVIIKKINDNNRFDAISFYMINKY